MGRMKDYAMWLEMKGYAEFNDRTESYEYTADYNDRTAFDEYRHDESWHGPPATTTTETDNDV